MAPQNAQQNRILRQLPPDELKAIERKLTSLDLKQETVLYPPDAPINRVYFPLAGMVSLLSVTQGGDAIETGIVGADGVVGGSCGSTGDFRLGKQRSN